MEISSSSSPRNGLKVAGGGGGGGAGQHTPDFIGKIREEQIYGLRCGTLYLISILDILLNT